VSAPARPQVRVGGRVTVLRGAGDIRMDRRAVPEPGPQEAVVRIRRAGICGTDVHAYRGRYDRVPITLGHDASGEVTALGSDITSVHLAVGQRVTVEPMLSCGACNRCRAGHRQLCPSSGYLGMTCDGVFADYIALPADRLVPLPETVSDNTATALEPVAVALHMIDRISGFTGLTPVAHVIGAGPLGVLLAQTIIAAGWQVTLYEPLAVGGRGRAVGHGALRAGDPPRDERLGDARTDHHAPIPAAPDA
jgi:threonine dehydrogenase-like Zn-dependent dehydrogenase